MEGRLAFRRMVPRRSRRRGLRAGLRPVLASACGGLDGLRCGVGPGPRAIPPESYGERPMSRTNLYTLDTAGQPIPATGDEIIAAARRHIAQRFRRGTSLDSPATVRDFLRLRLGTREFETFCCLYLDNRHRVIEFVELFRGTIDGASVHPREVVKEALRRNAAAVILVHPHPSGVAEPSHADELVTRRLREALQLVEIRVLDHLIVAGDDVVSFAEKGLL